MHNILLIMDASMPRVQIGLWQAGQWLSLYKTGSSALQGIFLGVEDCLKKTQKPLEAIGGIVYCEGPGSMLGIRLVSMAIRTWMVLPMIKGVPIYAYNTLAMAEALSKQQNLEKCHIVITEARRGFWFCKYFGSEEIQEIDKDAVETLGEAVVYLPQPKMWDNALKGLNPLDYNLSKAAYAFGEKGFFHRVEDVDARPFRKQAFLKWSGERHGKHSL